MNYLKRIVVIVSKLVSVLLIPYYLILDTHTTSGLHMDTTYLIANPIGYISSPSITYTVNSQYSAFWEQNQILYSILFILPMVLFSFYFGEHKTDRKTIIAGIGSILISYFSVNVVTPYMILFAPSAFYWILPNVVTLSMFVFVFWSILVNSWPTIVATDDSESKEGKAAQVRNIVGAWFPRNVATLIWICIAILPIALSFYPEYEMSYSQYMLNLAGGALFIQYSFASISGGGYYPTVMINTSFEMAYWASPYTLGLWIGNLILGVVTLQYIQRETTRKRLYSATGIILLLSIIPTVFYTIINIAFATSGYLSIPLPLYPIAMLLLARFANPPQVVTKDMIKVPLRTRIASIFQRGTKEPDSQESVPIDAENNEVDESSSQ